MGLSDYLVYCLTNDDKKDMTVQQIMSKLKELFFYYSYRIAWFYEDFHDFLRGSEASCQTFCSIICLNVLFIMNVLFYLIGYKYDSKTYDIILFISMASTAIGWFLFPEEKYELYKRKYAHENKKIRKRRGWGLIIYIFISLVLWCISLYFLMHAEDAHII